MMRAYVGLVSKQGIESFYAEDSATVKFLWRRVQRQRGRVVCFWSVLTEDSARVIRTALQYNCRQQALNHLQSHAHDYGLFVPYRDEETGALDLRLAG